MALNDTSMGAAAADASAATSVADSQNTANVKSAESTAAGIASPAPITDQGQLAANIFQPTTLTEDQQLTAQQQQDMRQVVRDGQIVYGEKPKPIQGINSKTSTSTAVDGQPLGSYLGGSANGAQYSGDAGRVVGMARSFLGTPYVWGGEQPGGFDCSGLVQYIFGKMGIHLPRLSYDQMAMGRSVSLNALRPGDLIGYHNGPHGQADHIAIYIGNGQIIEAPRPGRYVQIGHVHDTIGAFAVRILK